MGGRLPEVRDSKSRMQIQLPMMREKIGSVVAGNRYNKVASTHRYMSDDSIMGIGMFLKQEYRGYYASAHHFATSSSDPLSTPMFEKYAFMYKDPGT